MQEFWESCGFCSLAICLLFPLHLFCSLVHCFSACHLVWRGSMNVFPPLQPSTQADRKADTPYTVSWHCLSLHSCTSADLVFPICSLPLHNSALSKSVALLPTYQPHMGNIVWYKRRHACQKTRFDVVADTTVFTTSCLSCQFYIVFWVLIWW